VRKVNMMLLLAVVTSNAVAEWVKVGGVGIMRFGDEDITYDSYADPSTVLKTGSKIKMVSLFDNNTAANIDGKPYMSMKQLSEYDCKNEASRPLYTAAYTEKMGEGVMGYSEFETLKLKPIVPGTTNQFLWEFACGKK
jgi:hypothetical protein